MLQEKEDKKQYQKKRGEEERSPFEPLGPFSFSTEAISAAHHRHLLLLLYSINLKGATSPW
jgi:hypothetical protein